MATGYDGGGGVSSANQQLIDIPQGWTKIYFYQFSFYNTDACTVKINGGTKAIPLRAGRGFEIDKDDAPIYSFIIVESGINFEWLGAY